MIEPMMCGCGGRPNHDFVKRSYDGKVEETHYVSCKKCLTLTSGNTYEEAVGKWNLAMSGNRVRIHSVILDDADREIFAKPQKSGNPKRWVCGSCGSAIGSFWTYCQHCGTKIDWSVKNDNSN